MIARCLAVALSVCGAGAFAADWPHFLGPKHDNTSAETGLLLFGQFVLRVRNETRIVNLLHGRMLGKKIRDDAPVLVVSFHPNGKGFSAPKYQERIERREDSTYYVMYKIDQL